MPAERRPNPESNVPFPDRETAKARDGRVQTGNARIVAPEKLKRLLATKARQPDKTGVIIASGYEASNPTAPFPHETSIPPALPLTAS